MPKKQTRATTVTMKNEKPIKKTSKILGRGFDCGTGNMVSAYYDDTGQLKTNMIRDAFCVIESDKHKLKMLNDRNEDFIEKDGQIYLIGEKAKDYANIFGNKYRLRRPLARGVINPDEKDSHFVVREILKALLGKPTVNDEIVHFSVPAEPLDASFNQIFHENKFIAMINSLGFDARPINEAKAIIYSEAADTNYTGMAISMGAGMANIAISFEGDSSDLEFSLTKPGKDPSKKESFGCGDWIDANAAIAIGKETHEILDAKEEKTSDGNYILNLLAPESEEHFAISVFYKNLIKYIVANIKNGIDRLNNVPKFSFPVPVYIAGGTSMARGVKELFEAELKKYKWPFQFGEITMVKEPLLSVATGSLIASMAEYDEE